MSNIPVMALHTDVQTASHTDVQAALNAKLGAGVVTVTGSNPDGSTPLALLNYILMPSSSPLL
jgi:hypothetical protein